jgi:selenocysteine lyase/cysteine desulfurase
MRILGIGVTFYWVGLQWARNQERYPEKQVCGEFQGLRITPSVYTTLGEIDFFCEAMEGVLEKGLA